jgi:hypothetical protein
MNYGMKWKTALLIGVTLMSACVRTGNADCAGFKPIRLDAISVDGLTDRDAQAVLVHNVFGREMGCW